MSQKKLTRTPYNRKVAGVCGGLGEYFDMDPLVFRAIFLFLLFFGGSGLILYLLLWILIPEKRSDTSEESGDYEPAEIINNVVETAEVVIEEIINHSHKHKKVEREHKGVLWGFLLVAVGFLLLGRTLGFFAFYWNNVWQLWPLLIVWIGIALLPMGRAWKTIALFILLAIAIALLIMLSLKSCYYQPFWEYFQCC